MILEALFNGEIYASENVVPKSDKFREATGEIARIMSFFEDKLSKEDYALLERLCSEFSVNARFHDKTVHILRSSEPEAEAELPPLAARSVLDRLA